MRKATIYTKETTKHIILNYLLALLPLLLYGFYKNWLYVYMRGFTSFKEVAKQLFLIVLTIAIPVGIECITYFITKKKKIKKEWILSWSLLFSLLLFLIMPIKYNRIFYLVLLIMYMILIKILPLTKLPLNTVVLLKIIATFLLFFLGGYHYTSTYEASKNISYSLFNSFFGRTVGEFGTTNIFLILIGYFYLATTKNYKKEIPFYAFISYVLCTILLCFITKGNPTAIIRNCITTNFCFSIIFLATIPMNSPYTKEGIRIYAILTGIIGCMLMQFLSANLGIYFAILLTSSIAKLIDFLVLKVKR